MIPTAIATLRNIVDTRSTTGDHFYSNFDGLRAVAALLVMVMHFRTIPDLATGAPGVWLFFGLSGFLLYSGFLSLRSLSSRSMVAYLVRRLFRILPLYLVFVATYVYLFKGWDMDFKHGFFLNHGFFIHWKMHLWTVRAEMVFYLLLPLVIVLLAFFRSGVTRFLILILTAFISAFLFVDFFSMFFIGMAAVHARQWLPERFAAGTTYMSLSMIILLSYFGDVTEPVRNLLGITERRQIYQYGLVFFPLCFLVLIGVSRYQSRLFSNPWLRLIGVAGYGVYLWHILIKEWVQQWAPAPWLYQVLVYTVTIFLAIVTYVLVEKPGIDLGRRLARWINMGAPVFRLKPEYLCLLIFAALLGIRFGLSDPKIRVQVDIWSPARASATVGLHSEGLLAREQKKSFRLKEGDWRTSAFAFWDQEIDELRFRVGDRAGTYRVKNFYIQFPFQARKMLNLASFKSDPGAPTRFEGAELVINSLSPDVSAHLVYRAAEIQPWLNSRTYAVIASLFFALSLVLGGLLIDQLLRRAPARRYSAWERGQSLP